MQRNKLFKFLNFEKEDENSNKCNKSKNINKSYLTNRQRTKTPIQSRSSNSNNISPSPIQRSNSFVISSYMDKFINTKTKPKLKERERERNTPSRDLTVIPTQTSKGLIKKSNSEADFKFKSNISDASTVSHLNLNLNIKQMEDNLADTHYKLYWAIEEKAKELEDIENNIDIITQKIKLNKEEIDYYTNCINLHRSMKSYAKLEREKAKGKSNVSLELSTIRKEIRKDLETINTIVYENHYLFKEEDDLKREVIMVQDDIKQIKLETTITMSKIKDANFMLNKLKKHKENLLQKIESNAISNNKKFKDMKQQIEDTKQSLIDQINFYDNKMFDKDKSFNKVNQIELKNSKSHRSYRNSIHN